MITLLFVACAQTGNPALDTAGPDTAALPAASVLPGQIVITEVMLDPSAVDGDFGEWFEVRNVADVDVDLEGVIVHDDDGAGFAVEGPLRVSAGGYAVFGVSEDTATNGGVPVDVSYSIDAVKLGNEGDTVTLSADGTTLDAFTWDEAVFQLEEGEALQLDPSVGSPTDNDAPAAWCLATESYGDGDRGTPGIRNTDCR